MTKQNYFFSTPPEIKNILAEEVYTNIQSIINSDDLPSHKLVKLDTIITSLPDDVRKQIPTPPIIQNLPEDIREKAKVILYDKSIDIKERFEQLQVFLKFNTQFDYKILLPSDMIQLSPDIVEEVQKIEADHNLSLIQKLDKTYILLDKPQTTHRPINKNNNDTPINSSLSV